MTINRTLSKREWEVTERVLQGKTNKIIAATLSISERTVEFQWLGIRQLTYDYLDHLEAV